MKKITSVPHALEVLGQSIDFDKMKEGLQAAGVPDADVDPLVAHYQLTKVVEANNVINGNWKADWSDWEQDKWTVWKRTQKDASKPSGFGFSSSITCCWHTCTGVGARLTVGTHAEALYIGQDFEYLFEIAWFIIPVAPAAEQE